MRFAGSIVVAVAVLATSSARAAVELSTAAVASPARDAGAMGSRDSLGALDSWMNSGFTARSAADGDELFAVDDALLTRLGAPDPAAKRNPFARTLLLIIFAGLTAVFAGRKNGGRGLIAG